MTCLEDGRGSAIVFAGLVSEDMYCFSNGVGAIFFALV